MMARPPADEENDPNILNSNIHTRRRLPSGTGPRQCRRAARMEVKDLTAEFYCQTIAPFANPPKVAVATQGSPQEQAMPSFERVEA